MKHAFASLAILSALALQACSGGGGYYDSAAYDKDYQKYKMEKEVRHELKQEHSAGEMQQLQRDLEKKYGKKFGD
jgi:ABC-type glycerol-3-phosphate transport system substrate-binding protein